MQKVLK